MPATVIRHIYKLIGNHFIRFGFFYFAIFVFLELVKITDNLCGFQTILEFLSDIISLK